MPGCLDVKAHGCWTDFKMRLNEELMHCKTGHQLITGV